MAVVYISEADAVRDFASLLERVCAGTEVAIKREDSTVALLMPPENSMGEPEPGYDDWFGAQVDEALSDPRPKVDSEVVEAYFAKRRRASALKIAGLAG